MVAKLWVKKIKKGERKFSDVPAGLKDAVKELLIAEGLEKLVTE